MAGVVRPLLAELVKLWTLPEVWLTCLATVAGAAIVAVTISANNLAMGVSSATTCIRAVPAYIVLGVAVLGVIASTSEYRGNQIHSSLAAIPNRTVLAAAKLSAFVLTCSLLSLAAMCAASGSIGALGDSEVSTVVLAACIHLVAMGVIAITAGMAIRGLVGSLTTAIVALVVAPPVIVVVAPFASDWLPSVASANLFLSADGASALSSAISLSTWIVATTGMGYARLAWSDG